MVTKKNLMECVKKLMVHMDRAEGTYYRDELLAKIIQICSQNNYQHIINFEWWVLRSHCGMRILYNLGNKFIASLKASYLLYQSKNLRKIGEILKRLQIF